MERPQQPLTTAAPSDVIVSMPESCRHGTQALAQRMKQQTRDHNASDP